MSPKADLKPAERLRRNRQFQEIYTRGRWLSGPHLTIYFKPNQLKVSRLGLSVTKRRFKLSTGRHFLQRRLREAYRLNKIRFLPGYDLIISLKKFNKDKLQFKDLEGELLTLAQKAKLLKR